MAKPFKNLREQMTPERRKRNQVRTELVLFEMSLAEIRQHRQREDASVATDLPLDDSVDLQDLQNDMLLSTLINQIANMGGKLKLVAQFPDEEIVINQFPTETTKSPMRQ